MIFSILSLLLSQFLAAASAPSPIPNFGQVEPGIYRGATLSKDDQYRYLKENLSVDDVVDLRLKPDNQDSCHNWNLNCENFPIRLSFPGEDATFDMEMFKKAFSFVLSERAAGRQVYFHCKKGSDRTGALAAALLIREKACHRDFNPDELWNEVKNRLKQHHFHFFFIFLKKDIRSWVYHFDKNQWLCQEPN